MYIMRPCLLVCWRKCARTRARMCGARERVQIAAVHYGELEKNVRQLSVTQV